MSRADGRTFATVEWWSDEEGWGALSDHTGERVKLLFDLFEYNTRAPDQVAGDVEALVTANTMGAQRLIGNEPFAVLLADDLQLSSLGLPRRSAGSAPPEPAPLEALETALLHVDAAASGVNAALLPSSELLAEDLRLAHQALCSITGEFSADDLLGEIFSRFCIGK